MKPRYALQARSARIVMLAMTALWMGGGAASGATITVTSSADSGPGSLRDAVAAAVSGDTITFQFPAPSLIALQSAIQISGNMNLTIAGPGRQSLSLLCFNCTTFQIGPNGGFLNDVITISGLTLFPAGFGSISNYGLMVLNDVEIFGDCGTTNAAIYNALGLTITNSSIAGACFFGGASIVWNDAGGGVVISKSVLQLGDVFQLGITNNGRMRITESSVVAFASGGKLAVNAGNLSVVNSTIAGMDKGIDTLSQAVTSIVNSTITGSSTYGLFAASPSILNVKNTVLAGAGGSTSYRGNCETIAGMTIPGTSLGHNLSDDNSCVFLTGTGDQSNTPAGLGSAVAPFSDPNFVVYPLLSGSAAIDAVPTAPVNYCTDVDGVTPIIIDQRGMPRPIDAPCDAGAYETGALFSSFSPALTLFGTAANTSLVMTGTFTLGAQSSGINPGAASLSFRVGPYAVAIPAGSLRKIGSTWAYAGTIGGIKVQAGIAKLATNQYGFAVGAQGVNFTNVTGPVLATLRIGEDGGSATINSGR